MGMGTQQYWAEIDVERAAKRDKDKREMLEHKQYELERERDVIEDDCQDEEESEKSTLAELRETIVSAREAIGLDALNVDAMLVDVDKGAKADEIPGYPYTWGIFEGYGEHDSRFEGEEDRAEHEARVRLMKGGAK